MLPSKIRDNLFDILSVQTMRYVEAEPTDVVSGLNAKVYEMVSEEFFINGSITSHSSVPELMAGMWCGGRETVLVEDYIDRGTKEAMSAVLSQINDCPYCEDMLVSLVHAADENELAGKLSNRPGPDEISKRENPLLHWTMAVAKGEWNTPFPCEMDALPEALGSLLSFSYINRFSHVVMDGSPIDKPLGFKGLKKSAVRFFGHELKHTVKKELEPGRAIELLPVASKQPNDLTWASSNPRIKEALSRWFYMVEHHADQAVPEPVLQSIEKRVVEWKGETMPISRKWVEEETDDLESTHRSFARFGLLAALAPYQVDESIVEPVLQELNQKQFVKLLAWASLIGSRRIAKGVSDAIL